MIDKLTLNNISLGLPLIITKFINAKWTDRSQYSCRNLLKVDYNRGGEIVSQHQNNVNKENEHQNNRGKEIVSQIQSQRNSLEKI